MPYVVLHTDTLAKIHEDLAKALNERDTALEDLCDTYAERDAERKIAKGLALALKDLREAYEELCAEHNSMLRDQTDRTLLEWEPTKP